MPAHYRIFLLPLLLLTIFGCQNKGPSPGVTVEDAALYEKKNQEKLLGEAILYIQQGSFDQAKKKLETILRYNPAHLKAASYYRQLTQPASKLFQTTKVYQYKIRKGDQLSAIAQKWLGDEDYWVYLAVSNHLSQPQKLLAGTVIQIPLVKNNPIYRKNKRRSKANLNMVRKMVKQGNWLKAVERTTRVYVLKEDLTTMSQLEQAALKQLKKQANTDGKRIRLKHELVKILSRATNNWSRSPLRDLITTLENSLLFNEAEVAWNSGKVLQAAKLLVKAKRHDPNRARSATISQLQTRIINRLHAEAMVHYRNQRLDDALMRWQHVLLLDPGNELAQKYHRRTRKLLEKLKKL